MKLTCSSFEHFQFRAKVIFSLDYVTGNMFLCERSAFVPHRRHGELEVRLLPFNSAQTPKNHLASHDCEKSKLSWWWTFRELSAESTALLDFTEHLPQLYSSGSISPISRRQIHPQQASVFWETSVKSHCPLHAQQQRSGGDQNQS